MDYILRKFEASIKITKQGQTERFNYLKARIEYVFYLLLGYTWNKHKNEIESSELTFFSDSLDDKLALGRIINFIKKFDKKREVLTSNTEIILNDYNEYRKQNLGHGYTYNSADAEEKLNSIFQRLCNNVDLLKSETDIIIVTEKNEETWGGYCVSSDAQFPELWSCPKSIISNCTPSCVFYRFNGLSNDYFQLSPFIFIKKDAGTNLDFYMFFTSKDMPEGQAKYTNLFEDGKENFEIPQLTEMIIVDNYRKRSGSGVYINLFDTNYKKFVDVGVRETVDKFVRNNKAHVTAVLSGNGGVGKTACAQKVCMDLFSDKSRPYKFIVFASAKDRRFDEKIGKIEEIKSRVNNFYDVIVTIYRTLKDKEPDFSSESSESFTEFVDSFCEGKSGEKVLLVVDDFETFDNEEKEKIAAFLGNLDINIHKVIVTTRNSALIDGYKIQTDSFDEDGTEKFIRAKIEELYPQQLEYFNEYIKSEENKERVHFVTDGVPIFMLQWIHLYAQDHKNILHEKNLYSREDAINFLAGRVYNYFKDDAKILYAALSKVAKKGNLFVKDTLKSVCEKSIRFNTFEDAFDELVTMNVVEQCDNSQNTFRVYNESYMDDMAERFSKLPEPTRNSITNKLTQNLGGRVNLSPYDSLLEEAKSAYNRGSVNTAESTYRQIIKNSDFPIEKRVEALLQLLVMFTTNERYIDAINAFNEFKEFSDNPKVVERYIWTLWGCTADDQKILCQKTVFDFLNNYLQKHGSVDAVTLSTYALGATFYSKYVSLYLQNNNGELKKAFRYCYRVYQYVYTLSNDEFKKQILGIKTIKQNTDTAIIQGFDISAKLYATDETYKKQMLEIAGFYNNRYPQNTTNRKHITNTLSKMGMSVNDITKIQNKTNEQNVIPLEELYSFSYLYSKKNQQTGGIWGYLGTVNLDDQQIKALLHIKECAQKYISPEEMLDFEQYIQNNTIKVKLKQTDKGWSASLIGVSPSFDDYLNN